MDKGLGFGTRDVCLTLANVVCQALMSVLALTGMLSYGSCASCWKLLTSVLILDISLDNHAVGLTVFSDTKGIILLLQRQQIHSRRPLLRPLSRNRLCATHLLCLTTVSEVCSERLGKDEHTTQGE